jgi:hypothetical protein
MISFRDQHFNPLLVSFVIPCDKVLADIDLVVAAILPVHVQQSAHHEFARKLPNLESSNIELLMSAIANTIGEARSQSQQEGSHGGKSLTLRSSFL